jgi:hypothetical protein
MKIGPDNRRVSIGETLCSDRAATVITRLAIGFVRFSRAERKIDICDLVVSDHQTVAVLIDDSRKSLGRDAPY